MAPKTQSELILNRLIYAQAEKVQELPYYPLGFSQKIMMILAL
jgi:hypothetical protein